MGSSTTRSIRQIEINRTETRWRSTASSDFPITDIVQRFISFRIIRFTEQGKRIGSRVERTSPVIKCPIIVNDVSLNQSYIKRTVPWSRAFRTTGITDVIRYNRGQLTCIGVNPAIGQSSATKRSNVGDAAPDEGTGQFRIKNPQRWTQLVGVVGAWFNGLWQLQCQGLLQIKINRKADKACILNSETSVQLEVALVSARTIKQSWIIKCIGGIRWSF